MSFIVIVLCLGVQWFFSWESRDYQYDWLNPYFLWMKEKLPVLTTGHGLAGLLLLALPPVLLVSILFSLIYHLLGTLGYFVLSLAIYWYFLDLGQLTEGSIEIDDQQLTTIYRNVFARSLWFFVFGPVGLVIYVVITEFQKKLVENNAFGKELPRYFSIAENIVDWVPMRLLGLSFALVGHFSVVFKSWSQYLFKGLHADLMELVQWSKQALEGAQKVTRTQLLQRSLLVWMVVMALFSL